MRILACIPFHYYDSLDVPLSYYYVVESLRSLGHTVHLFEFVEQAVVNKDGMNEFFVDTVRRGGYDLVFVETSKDEFHPSALDEAGRYAVTLAWNSDDDWRWDSYSSHWCPHYTYMVTTYRRVYEENRNSHENLLLSQWACTGFFDGSAVAKDIPCSFVGGVYGRRTDLLRHLQHRVGLQLYASGGYLGSGVVARARRKVAAAVYGQPVTPARSSRTYEAVNEIWNRSRVSLTPLEASQGSGMQIKARVFEMGLSGTVMLCSRNPELYEYYEPGTEFLEYGDDEECVHLVKGLLSDEAMRARIAANYYRRTRAEHMWSHRYGALFAQIGLS